MFAQPVWNKELAKTKRGQIDSAGEESLCDLLGQRKHTLGVQRCVFVNHSWKLRLEIGGIGVDFLCYLQTSGVGA